MSRHSKWAKIKRQKAATDVRRSQRFTKLSRAITVAARERGGDPETNVKLRIAIDRGLAENMPKENIQRAIDRATGADAEAAMTSFVLEGYGPGGAALLIESVTDNRNRTIGSIRRLLDAAGGSLGEAGSTQWMFERRGQITFDDLSDPERVELAAIDAGALNTSRENSSLEILTVPESVHAVADTLTRLGHSPTAAGVVFVPTRPLTLTPADTEKLQALLETLEEHEDVVDVTTNALPAESPT